MKKYFWMFGMAVAAFTSCTQSEVVDIPANRAIGFDTYVEKASRAEAKAADVTMSMSEFHVFGYFKRNPTSVEGTNGFEEAFNNTEVKKEGDRWEYVRDNELQRYWNKNSVYHFGAYANGLDHACLQSTEPSGNGYVTFTPETQVLSFDNYQASQNDLVAAINANINVGSEVANPNVRLHFYHLLSRVEFSFIGNTKTPLQIQNVEIYNAYNTGSTVFSATTTAPTWTPGTGVSSTTAAYKEERLSAVLNNQKAEQYVFYVIPQDNKNIIVKFDLVLTAEEGETDRTRIETYIANLSTQSILSHTQWKTGNAYQYVLSFGEDYELVPIDFEVGGVETWRVESSISNGINLTPQQIHIDTLD